MTPNMQETKEDIFKRLVKELGTSTHGNANYEGLKEVARKLGTDKAIKLLRSLMICDQIKFDDVGERTWPDEEDRKLNKFSLLQGDLVFTTKVDLPGKTSLTQDHSSWLCLSPSCDAIRAEFCRMAPAFPVYGTYKESKESAEKSMYNFFRVSLGLMSIDTFAFPALEEDAEDDLMGYLVDLRIPGFLRLEHRDDVSVYASLTVEGWHLLNMVIQQRETRATMADEMKMRPQILPN